MNKIKIVVLGDGGVGKSSLCIKFVAGKFSEAYDPTVEDSYVREVNLDEEKVSLELLDTAGQDDFSSIRESYYLKSPHILLVFDLTNRGTMEFLTSVWSDLKTKREEAKEAPAHAFIAGNKCDLPNAIGEQEVSEWVEKEFPGVPFLLTSAFEGVNVTEVFEQMARLSLEFQKTPPKKGKAPAEKKEKKKKEGGGGGGGCILF